MWRSRMFWQLFGSNAALILFSLGLFSFLAVSQMEHAELGEIEARLRGQVLLVREALRERDLSQERQVFDRIEQLKLQPTRVTLIDRKGHVVLDSVTHVPEDD